MSDMLQLVVCGPTDPLDKLRQSHFLIDHRVLVWRVTTILRLSDILDHPHPVIRIQLATCEFCNHRKHLIRESANVQNVGSLFCLHSSIWLNVDTNHSCRWIALLEVCPFPHRFCRTTSKTSVVRCINP